MQNVCFQQLALWRAICRSKIAASITQVTEPMELTVKATLKDGVLTITIPVQTPTESASGKTLVVASSHGNQPTTVMIDGKPVVIGLNAYIRK